MRFSRHRGTGQKLGELPLTSLIDVVFLLLIYFLVTADFTGQESDLSSALGRKSAEGGVAADLLPQVLRVERRQGSESAVYKLGGREFTDGERLTEVLRKLPKEAGVFVRVSDGVRVEDAAAAIQACKDAGFLRVSYVPGE